MNFKSLISENNRDISMGRVSFWILTAILIYFWVAKFIFLLILGIQYSDVILLYFAVPDGLLTSWIGALFYNAYKKLPFSTENIKIEDKNL
jgi:hypothetical protein